MSFSTACKDILTSKGSPRTRFGILRIHRVSEIVGSINQVTRPDRLGYTVQYTEFGVGVVTVSEGRPVKGLFICPGKA